jgi:DNA-binding transcriptional ArsR family regulator
MTRSEIEKISKALADRTRLRMRGVTPATVSHHLKILSEAGLITCRREGQFVYNRANPTTIAAYARALAKIANGRKTKRR